MITYTLVMTYVLVGMFLMGFSVCGLKDAKAWDRFALPIIVAGLWPIGVVWVFIIEPIVEWWRGKKS